MALARPPLSWRRQNAGIILGAKVPIVLVSRSDSAESKLASIAAGSVLAHRMHLA